MKIKEGFLMRELAGEFVVVSVSNKEDAFKGMIQMNKLGAFLWNELSEERSREELLKAVLEKYEVETERAQKDIDTFIEKLSAAGILEV